MADQAVAEEQILAVFDQSDRAEVFRDRNRIGREGLIGWQCRLAADLVDNDAALGRIAEPCARAAGERKRGPPACGRGDVLLAVEFETHRSRLHWKLSVDFPFRFTGRCIEGAELAIERA